ncbi:hypothetical protein RV16_GL001638 [Enterococcus saccharolyticus]|nr:hypothetical protein RV16_GL001638 [Enterococcus saccharolyticus]
MKGGENMIDEWINQLTEQRVLYLLAVLAIAMMIDFFSGVLAAKIKQEITSKIGINGILRKIASMILLVFFLPVAFILPAYTGIAMLYVLYVGYLCLEIQSILENYKKMGMNTAPFRQFLLVLKELINKK